MFHSSLLEGLSSYAQKHLDIVQQIQLSTQKRFMSARFKPSWACGRALAQELGSDLMVCSFAGNVHKLYINGVRPEEYGPCLGLNVMMAGQVGWTDSRGRQHQNAGLPELWCQCGGLEWRQALMHPGPVSQCHVAATSALLEHWLGNVAEGAACQRIEWCLRQRTRVNAMQVCKPPATMLKTAAQLQALLRSAPGGLALAQRLQVEGLALTLLGQWLELPLQAPCAQKLRRYRAVDDAIDIIRAELSEDLSISGLARRVGANECYLKHDFRERTGMGIAAFVRQQRMARALGLLEEARFSVRQVAHEVGYHSLGHFAQAFRAAHGVLPSEVQGKRFETDGENVRKM